MVDRLLIAERGEIAIRIARTCKRLGIEAVALRGPSDSTGVHLGACDRVIDVDCERDAPASAEAVAGAAKEGGVDAVHPGYAAPLRHLALARACAAAEVGFVGADVEPLERALDRLAVRELAAGVDVRPVPGGAEAQPTAHRASHTAEQLGWPVLLRPRIAGASAGIFVADDEDEIDEAFTACQRAAERRTGDPGVVVEAQIERPRLVEVGVVADAREGVAAVGERERSLWARGSALVEECPAPALGLRHDGEAIRDALADAAIRVMRETGIVDVASVRFLLDKESRFWFLGLEPGLPVHHPITEMVTGLDLVELQLRARTESLQQELRPIQPSGHACAARVRAVTSTDGGGEPVTVTETRWPPAPHGKLRVDPSVVAGSVVDPSAEPLLVKITSYAPIRHQAALMLDRILAATVVAPLETNVATLRTVLGNEAFRAGQYDLTSVQRFLQAD